MISRACRAAVRRRRFNREHSVSSLQKVATETNNIEMQQQQCLHGCFSVAPMMGLTHRHQRALARLLLSGSICGPLCTPTPARSSATTAGTATTSTSATSAPICPSAAPWYTLYTEMVTAAAVNHNWAQLDPFKPPVPRKLAYAALASHHIPPCSDSVDPLGIHRHTVLQLGGACPRAMAMAASIGRVHGGYQHININAGCPSPRVAGAGAFGASLMLQPDVLVDVARAVGSAMGGSAPSVKCRIGVTTDRSRFRTSSSGSCNGSGGTNSTSTTTSMSDLHRLIERLHEEAGVTDIVLHCRYAIIHPDFSPADNRSVPPLQHEVAYQLVRDFPTVNFILNGGVETAEQAVAHMANGMHGVMVGRSVTSTPYPWHQQRNLLQGMGVDSTDKVLGEEVLYSRAQLCDAYADYADAVEAEAAVNLLQGGVDLEMSEKSGTGSSEAGTVAGRRVSRNVDAQLRSTRLLLVKPLHNLYHGMPGSRAFNTAVVQGAGAVHPEWRNVLPSGGASAGAWRIGDVIRRAAAAAPGRIV